MPDTLLSHFHTFSWVLTPHFDFIFLLQLSTDALRQLFRRSWHGLCPLRSSLFFLLPQGSLDPYFFDCWARWSSHGGVTGLPTTTPLLSSWHNSSGVSPLAGHCYLHTIAGNRGLINCSSEMSMNVWVSCVGQKIICGEIHKTSGICKCFMMTWLFSKHSHLLTSMSHESLHTGKTSKPLTYSSPSSATLTAESIHCPVRNRDLGSR